MWKGGSRGGGSPPGGGPGGFAPGPGVPGGAAPRKIKNKKNYNFVFLCYSGEHYLASTFQVGH